MRIALLFVSALILLLCSAARGNPDGVTRCCCCRLNSASFTSYWTSFDEMDGGAKRKIKEFELVDIRSVKENGFCQRYTDKFYCPTKITPVVSATEGCKSMCANFEERVYSYHKRQHLLQGARLMEQAVQRENVPPQPIPEQENLKPAPEFGGHKPNHDAMNHILRFLEPVDLKNARLANKHLQSAVDDILKDPKYWERLYRQLLCKLQDKGMVINEGEVEGSTWEQKYNFLERKYDPKSCCCDGSWLVRSHDLYGAAKPHILKGNSLAGSLGQVREGHVCSTGGSSKIVEIAKSDSCQTACQLRGAAKKHKSKSCSIM